MKFLFKRFLKLSKNAPRIFSERGLSFFFRRILEECFRFSLLGISYPIARWQLNNILRENAEKRVVILLPFIDWGIPLFQRPHHIAKCLADSGYLYFFCSPCLIDRFTGFKKLGNGLYLSNFYELILNKVEKVEFVHAYSTDLFTEWEVFESLNTNKIPVVYEYVDEISPEISGGPISEELYKRHRLLLAGEERCAVVATADLLLEEVRRTRKRNFGLVTNGVDNSHFNSATQRLPEKIAAIKESGKILIGYHGALAPWFDFELVRFCAEKNPDCHWFLIGPKYGKADPESEFLNIKNITLAGAMDYSRLPEFSGNMDLLTIPFVINDVTLSTSPIKVFEYMALGKPIITTAMPECRKYKSVLIANSKEEFSIKIRQALKLREDSNYLAVLKQEANQNTWQKKTQEIVTLFNDSTFQKK